MTKKKPKLKIKQTSSSRVSRHRGIRKIINETKNAIEKECNSEQLQASFESILSSFQEGDETDNPKPLKDQLRSWVNCFGISTRAVNSLLRILLNSGNSMIKKNISLQNNVSL